MARLDRREKVALDESYRYYRSLEAGEEPAIFKLTHALRTLSTALAFADKGEFKLTRQLWKRLHQALFDHLVNAFAGELYVFDAEAKPVKPGDRIPSDGYVQFRPHGCKRSDDMAQVEVARVYPKTLTAIENVWKDARRTLRPEDVHGIKECADGVCMMKPMVVGHEVLGEESRAGKTLAYQRWWDLYWQAYCTPSKQERSVLYKHMMEIESVWGEMYY